MNTSLWINSSFHLEGTRSLYQLVARTIKKDNIFRPFCPSFYPELFIKIAEHTIQKNSKNGKTKKTSNRQFLPSGRTNLAASLP